MLITKIEAKQACDWLRAAGFPQYAQLFKDCHFPIDLELAKSDHAFLEREAIDSLCRRLITLNKCAGLSHEAGSRRRRNEDSEDNEPFAISSKWTFDRQNNCWVRQEDEDALVVPNGPKMVSLQNRAASREDENVEDHREEVNSGRSSCSFDSDSGNNNHGDDFCCSKMEDGEASMSYSSSSRCSSSFAKAASPDDSFNGPPSPPPSPTDLYRCEDHSLFVCPAPRPKKKQHRKGASLLRKMERLRLRAPSSSTHIGVRSRSLGRPKPLIGSPVLQQEGFGQGGLKQLNCQDTEDIQSKAHTPGVSCSSPSPSNLSTSTSSSSSSSSSSSPSSCSSPSGPSSNVSECGSTVSTPSPVTRVRANVKRARARNEEQCLIQKESFMRDAEQNLTVQRNQQNQRHLLSDTLFQVPDGYKPGTFPTALSHGHPAPGPAPSLTLRSPIDNTSVNWRTGSFHGLHSGRRCHANSATPSPCSPLAAADQRISIYDNVPDNPSFQSTSGDSASWGLEEDVFRALDGVMERINSLQQLVISWAEKLSEDGESDSSQGSSSPSLSDIHLEVKETPAQEEAEMAVAEPPEEGDTEDMDGGSLEGTGPQPLNVHSHVHWWSEEWASMATGADMELLSASQMNLLRRLSLLRLTVIMDRFSPSCKQGWIWAGPNPQRPQKKSQMKNRRVFGVPLLHSVQTSGTPLPTCILRAMQYLKLHGMNQVGLFRKPGVKSRIQTLREMVEADPEGISFVGQSAFDVADMVKQYFRDLPEPLFSERLNETFLHIYQYFPKEQQLAAVRAAIFLLPDERREALHSLLLFLREAASRSAENQMSATNIAVCLAPSIFHLCHPRPHKRHPSRKSRHAAGSRKHSPVKPDQRDLSESLAATQGLAHMLSEVTRLFQPPPCSVTTVEPIQGEPNDEDAQESVPEDDQEESPWLEQRARLQESAQRLLLREREAKEKARGWLSCPCPVPHVHLAHKKVDDSQALRVWRGSVEVEAPQQEALQRLLEEHEAWGGEVLKEARVLEVLGKDADVYSYTLQGAGCRPPLQHVLLRSWQSDPSIGPLYVAAVSVDHPDASLQGGLRAQVHSCLFLVESLGVKRSRITHYCRTDTRGRSSEWHNKVSGHQLASELLRLRDSFKAKARGL